MSTRSTPAALILTAALAAGLAAAPAGGQTRPPDPDWTFAPRWPVPPPEEEASPFLLERTDVRARISGPVARVVVTQKWRNPNPDPVDGVYIFPLPETAAVTDLSFRIGERRIRAEVRRREEARALYEKTRRAGQVAALLDQERPNVFAQQVANIMPGVEIDVILTFDQEIRCEGGGCEYVFPTVVGPRFVPARQADPGRITPPVAGPGSDTGQRLALSVDLDAGIEVHDLGSPSHRVRLTALGAGRARAVLADEAARLDRDFRLRWGVGGEAPQVAVLAWRDPTARQMDPAWMTVPDWGGAPEREGFFHGDAPGVFTLVLQPPSRPEGEEIAAREIVFVIDCSGSMSGAPLEAARNVVRQALRRLRPGDTFQLIQFSMSAAALGTRPLPANPPNIQRALRHLDSLRGEGGTEMIHGIRAALDYPPDPERLRIVAFLTDGYIGNESEILAEVRRRIGAARLFSFGIGSSVNRYLLESLAEEGRGSADFLAPRETPEEMVSRFVERIDAPVFTDIRILWRDLEVEDLEPARLPDLFAGQPLLLHGRYRRPGSGLVEVSGRQGGARRLLRATVTFPERAPDHQALGRLWARARIHRLERELHGGRRPEIQESITLLGLQHRLVTAWTSLVAVDTEISNHYGRSAPIEVPVEMPQDVSHEGVWEAKAQAVAPAAPAPWSSSDRSRALEESRIEEETLAAGAARPPDATFDVARGAIASSPFERLTLVDPKGARLVIEADGEVWRIEGRSRLLARSLDAALIEDVRRTLAAARPAEWRGSGCGRRLEIEAAGRRAVICLPSGDAEVEALAALVERLAS
jgi:Ca-activated chloride channel family protein